MAFRGIAPEQEYCPATPDQIDFAMFDLGIELPADVTMGQISKLIEAAQAVRPASDDQRRHARRIGLAIPEGVTMREMSKLLDREIERLTQVAARNQLLRPGNQIAYLTWPYEVIELSVKSKKLTLTLGRTVDRGPRGYRRRDVALYLMANCVAPTKEELAKPLMF